MIRAMRPGGRPGREPFRPSPRIFAAMLAGLFLAVLSFSQVAASIGMAIDTFRPLGGGFFSWRAGQTQLAINMYEGRTKVVPAKLIGDGQTGLGYAPLSARSLWMVGQGYERMGNKPRARQAMARAEQISRRDAAVQIWLADDQLRRGMIASALRHYDLIVRTQPDAAGEAITRLALIMTAPQGRRYLQPYIRADNGWLPALIGTAAGKLPKAEPIGRLFVERKAKAPDLPELDPIYAKIVYRLVEEGSHDVAIALYPLLPRSNAAALGDVRPVIDGKPVDGYPPFTWYYADSGTQGATLIGLARGETGVEFFGTPGTIGIAATKLVAPRGATQLQWQVYDRSVNLQGSANWIATCLSGASKGKVSRSADLLAGVPVNKSLTMSLPAGCDLVRIDMRIAGGIGRNPSMVAVGRLRLSGAAAKN